MSFDLDNFQPTEIHDTTGLVQWLRDTRIDEIECLLPDVNGMMDAWRYHTLCGFHPRR